MSRWLVEGGVAFPFEWLAATLPFDEDAPPVVADEEEEDEDEDEDPLALDEDEEEAEVDERGVGDFERPRDPVVVPDEVAFDLFIPPLLFCWSVMFQ